MSSATNKGPARTAPVGGGQSTGTEKRPARKRREYSHEMSERDKVALRMVLQAKAVCTSVAVAIQEGKPIQAGVINKCLELAQSATSMLFD